MAEPIYDPVITHLFHADARRLNAEENDALRLRVADELRELGLLKLEFDDEGIGVSPEIEYIRDGRVFGWAHLQMQKNSEGDVEAAGLFARGNSQPTSAARMVIQISSIAGVREVERPPNMFASGGVSLVNIISGVRHGVARDLRKTKPGS